MTTEKLRNQKDNLARLMATENLTIVHKAIPTAYFDVKNRVLACPTFKDDISPALYDLFMGHEVGHALNTPYEGLHSTITENRTLKGYLNVVEDVRIEKAIKNKYQGLRTSFFKAYNELMDRNFFGIKGRDLQELSLIDKINLITKCGSRVDIILNTEEIRFLNMAEDCKTWEDVVECATAIYEWSKEHEQRDESDEAITMRMPDEEDFEQDENDEWVESPYGGEESDEESDEEIDDGLQTEDELEEDAEQEVEEIIESGKKGGNFDGKYDELDGARESITEHYAHNNEEEFVDENACIKTTIPLRERFKEADIDNIVYPYKRVIQDFKDYTNCVKEKKDAGDDDWQKQYLNRKIENRQLYLEMNNFYRKYIQKKNKKIVAHMAKEFEMRQNAHRNAKAFTGTSGQLDMNRLAKYQIVDDIFKRVTYIPDGKNHGLNVLVDWSGSIHNEVADLLEQSLILAEFCRKVQIPFRVYLFSDAVERDADDYYSSSGEGRLIEILSNEQSSRDYTEMFNNISAILISRFHEQISYCWNNKKRQALIEEYNKIFGNLRTWNIEEYSDYDGPQSTNMYPQNYRLGGTPLDHTLVAMRKLLPEFNHKYKVEKSILTVITDGYSHSSRFFQGSDEETADITAQQETGDSLYRSRYNSKRYFLDPYINKTYLYEDKTGDNYYRSNMQTTQNILEWLTDTCNVIVTGYFVFSKKNEFRQTAIELMGNSAYDLIDNAWKDMRKSGYVIETQGYNKLFLTSASTLAATGEDELDDEFVGANKNRVMAAFKRNQKGKTTSRFLTNEFIKEIA